MPEGNGVCPLFNYIPCLFLQIKFCQQATFGWPLRPAILYASQTDLLTNTSKPCYLLQSLLPLPELTAASGPANNSRPYYLLQTLLPPLELTAATYRPCRYLQTLLLLPPDLPPDLAAVVTLPPEPAAAFETLLPIPPDFATQLLTTPSLTAPALMADTLMAHNLTAHTLMAQHPWDDGQEMDGE